MGELPPLRDGIFETNQPIWNRICKWGGAPPGREAGVLADQVDAAITAEMTAYAFAARAPLEEEIARLREALSAILSSTMCDPGRGKVTEGRWVTINAKAIHVALARAALGEQHD